jgi:hypothetical protein
MLNYKSSKIHMYVCMHVFDAYIRTHTYTCR